MVRQRIGDCRVDHVVALAVRLDHHIADIVEVVAVVSCVTTQCVGARPAIERIGAVATDKRVGAAIAVQRVGAIAAVERLASIAAAQNVVAGAALHLAGHPAQTTVIKIVSGAQQDIADHQAAIGDLVYTCGRGRPERLQSPDQAAVDDNQCLAAEMRDAGIADIGGGMGNDRSGIGNRRGGHT